MMDRHLQHLLELQVLDSRIAGLERKLEASPSDPAIRAAVRRRKAGVDAKGQLDSTRKDIRTKEKDLEYQGQRKKPRRSSTR